MANFMWWILLIFGTNLNSETLVEGRAVNISNTWTLPQEGFSVFYRFFRDKISWFEADAVCQFHHANLVTVDNGIQFDAARAFLKELDVTEPVWIGLMRPQNSERFVWTNAKPLAPTSGYWAESLPAIDSPLCAVIDPLRDFRWHALRCGGPETAAFLCELSVPSWASDCAITAMPSLTIQYMSDSGTVQLSRDCGDEGGRHMTCKGKQDRDTILKQLICTDENAVEMSVNNLIMPEDNASAVRSINHEVTPAKEMENAESDNTEDNNIDMTMNRADATGNDNSLVKITLEDLMVGDQPIDESQTLLTDEVTKTPSQKKVLPFDKKPYSGKRMRGRNPLDDMMMGDQAAGDVTTAEVLPHVKKMLQQDLKLKDLPPLDDTSLSPDSSSDTSDKIVAPSTFIPATETGSESTTTVILSTTTMATSPEPHRDTTVLPINETSSETDHLATASITNDIVPAVSGVASSSDEGTGKNIIHPLHISSDSSKQASGFVKTPRRESSQQSQDDHFIPPMLLVKAKFTATSTRSHFEVATESPNSTINSPEGNQTEGAAEDIRENATETDNKEESSTPDDLPSSSPTVSPPVNNGAITDKVELIQEVTPSVSSSRQSPAPSGATVSGESVRGTTEDVNSTSQGDKSTSVATDQETTLSPSSSNYLLAQRRLDYENSFSNIENYQPYRPNRRRSLTKPDSVSYLKKILG
uniref:Putative proteoglycan 4-like protein n=1 Tax=Phlebotomus kandelakii TaxID=1109342 RepID=A0A6B2EFG8_9DIPT